MPHRNANPGDSPESLEQMLSRARQQARQEFVQLQIIGRALTPEEQRRSDALEDVAGLLDQAISRLAQPGVPTPPEPEFVLREGSYSAGNDRFSGDLRIDRGGEVISLDLYLGTGNQRAFRASLRSDPGEEIGESERFIGIIAEDDQGEITTGMIEFQPVSEEQASVTIELDDSIQGLPAQTPILLSATWRSDAFRTVGIEIEREQGVDPLPEFDFDGVPVTVESCFRDAGIELAHVGEHDLIPAPAQKWDDANLHGLMVQFADIDLSRRAWRLNLLHLSETRDGALLGVMFDSGLQDENGLPRQGAAVFVDPMRGHRAGFERKVIQTTVHELGHALNLAHRFEREVGRADSTSFMNYDWRYLGGGMATEFWRRFEFRFDEDEVRFLRHAPWHKIVPGGAEFHTVPYWSEGGGGYSPYLPEVPLSDLTLRLIPPAGAAVFEFAQPVFLTVELENNSGEPLDIPDFFLDPKSGLLEILVERQTGIGGGDGDGAARFQPIFNRCFDAALTTAEVIPDGGTMSNNVNLTFGSAGFTFAEPGNYHVQAVLAITDRIRRVQYVVRSEPLPIRIAYPRSAEEENDALKLFTQDVGFYLMLGGSDVLPEAKAKLEQVRERRMYRKQRVTDPLVAAIVRCQAINASREFVRVEAPGKYSKRSADVSEALAQLEKIQPVMEKAFDPATARQGAAFAKRLSRQGGKAKKARAR